jgi:Cu+-exporting ATPase
VTGVVPVPGETAAEVLRLAAAVEAGSEHPLAAAVLAAARARGLAVPAAQGFAAEAGHGVRAEVEGRAVAVGAARMMDEVPAALDAPAAAAAAGGASLVYVRRDDRVIGLVAAADPVKPSAAPAVRALATAGIDSAMITGDNPAAAAAIARGVGIDRVTAGVLPEGKTAALGAFGAGTAFVGDGLNDAPALAAADVGIAIGTGTDVAIEAGDVVLVSGDPMGVARAVALSRATMRNIRQNLIWAFGYNVALIPVAAGALVPFGGPQLSPMLAAGAMALSSVLVVTNALRLRRFGGGAA